LVQTIWPGSYNIDICIAREQNVFIAWWRILMPDIKQRAADLSRLTKTLSYQITNQMFPALGIFFSF